MSERIFLTVVGLGILIGSAFYINDMRQRDKECRARSGVLVKGAAGWECVAGIQKEGK